MRETGTVIRFGTEYGFIRRIGLPDLFCHQSALRAGDLEFICKGSLVEFEVTTSRSGRPQAANVILLEGRGL